MLREIPSRTKLQLKRFYEEYVQLLKTKEFMPKIHSLDNETSKRMKYYMDAEGITYQLKTAGSHRHNIAEKDIRTFKNHFISGLYSLPEKFPLNLWERLLQQAEITINILRTSRINPSLSAYAKLHGAFDYNANSLAPSGMNLLSQIPPDKRLSWEPHAEPGFYLGPALKHYRCHRIWMTKTAAERII